MAYKAMDESATKDKDVQSDKKDRFDVYLEKIYGPTVPDEFYLDENLTAMGKKAHELYLEARKKEGSSKADEWPVWDKLSPADKEVNKEQARYIPEQLDSLGYCICYADSDLEEVEITPEDKEIMARAEHDRWMGNKFSQGRTRPRFEGDDDFPHHKDLIDWKNLKPEEKKKDYEVIESYPILLAHCNPKMKICQLLYLRNKPACRYCKIPLTYVQTVLIRDHLQELHNIVIIVHGLTHSHYDNIRNSLTRVPCDLVYLVQHLRYFQTPYASPYRRCAELTSHPASYLRRYAHRITVMIPHQDTLNSIPVTKFKQILPCAVVLRNLHLQLLQIIDHILRLKLLPQPHRQIRHLIKRTHQFHMQPLIYLPRPERLLAKLRQFRFQLFNFKRFYIFHHFIS